MNYSFILWMISEFICCQAAYTGGSKSEDRACPTVRWGHVHVSGGELCGVAGSRG